MGKYSRDWDLLVSSSICEDFVEFLINNLSRLETYFDRSYFYLDEFPKQGTKYHSIKFESRLRLGIIPLEHSIEQELSQKDFSVNTLCFSVRENKFLMNEFSKQACEDLDRKVLRCVVGPKETFGRTPSRVLRLLRLKVKLGYKIDPSIFKYLVNH